MGYRMSRGLGYIILAGVIILALVVGLIASQPYGSPLGWLIRGAALLGYLTLFLAIVSSAYIRQISRVFGRPFIKVHHILSVTGLILVTLHPLGVALDSASLRVFLPTFDSLPAFLRWGGRPAWYLIAIASTAAVLRKIIGSNWRVVHLLNYVAFLLGTAHAIMIGTDFRHNIIKAIAAALSLVTIGVSIRKRFQKRRQ